jgi:hypothetical protein
MVHHAFFLTLTLPVAVVCFTPSSFINTPVPVSSCRWTAPKVLHAQRPIKTLEESVVKPSKLRRVLDFISSPFRKNDKS